MNFVIWIRECDHRAFHQDLPRSINLNYVIARMIGSYAGAVPTDKLPFQWNLVSYRLSTMLILNMSMRSALRHSYGVFLENRFSRLKRFFEKSSFLVNSEYTVYWIVYETIFIFYFTSNSEENTAILILLHISSQANDTKVSNFSRKVYL